MTTLNLVIGTGNDDASQSATNGVSLTNTSPDWAAGTWNGYRFTGVTIPQAATIDTAALSIYFRTAADDNVNAVLYMNDEDDASAFSTTDSYISNLARTTASVSWVNADVVGGTPAYASSPSMVSPVQEVVDRAGWASGNAMIVIVNTPSGGGADVQHYDGDSTKAAKLDIDYTAGGGATVRLLASLGVGS